MVFSRIKANGRRRKDRSESWEDYDEVRPSLLHKIIRIILIVIALILVLAAVFTILAERWAFSYWRTLQIDEIIYHLTAPLEGTGGNVINAFIAKCIVPTAVIMILITVLTIYAQRYRWYNIFLLVEYLVAILIIVFGVRNAWTRLDIGTYLRNQNNDSDFIETKYVDPDDVEITFPEEKRNLVYIFLESMEMTYADRESGGGFKENIIPELTELALENESFAGGKNELNGGYVVPGATFTMGGLFAQTSGLPLQVGLKATIFDGHGSMNEMGTQDHFFPSITTIGDILEDQGYNQVFFLGSDAAFAGRNLYFEEHGDYKIKDLIYAEKKGWISNSDLDNTWGMFDWRLFDHAKDELLRLAEKDEPFNFTLLTVDTHFEDGFLCPYCDNEYGDDRYANVMACSSRQVTEFVEWIMEQDFYENTTIVLCGDHTTMDSDFCDDVDRDYNRRVYTAYINSAVSPESTSAYRTYTTLDNFPTTLAAMGVQIEGDRLGLGVNLFSLEPTLYEVYGQKLMSELNKKSEFMEQISEFDPTTEEYKAYLERHGVDTTSMTNSSESGAESKKEKVEPADPIVEREITY